MKFSVLMSVYCNDKAEFLFEAINSLKNQTLPADEIVIVCDGPVPDKIKSILEDFKKVMPINLIYSDKNLGLGLALNLGLSEVSYEWVFRMDSDDISLPNRFESQINEIRKNPSLEVIGGWIEEFEIVPGDIKSFRRVPINNDNIYANISRYCPFNHVTVAFKKESVTKSGSYIGGKNFQEDYYLWLRMASNRCQFYNVPEVLVYVRAGDAMLGRRGGWQYYKNEVFVNYYGYKNNLVPLHIFFSNLVIKFFTRMSPFFVRKFLYKVARKHINTKTI